MRLKSNESQLCGTGRQVAFVVRRLPSATSDHWLDEYRLDATSQPTASIAKQRQARRSLSGDTCKRIIRATVRSGERIQ
jgi:hypothetical protein